MRVLPVLVALALTGTTCLAAGLPRSSPEAQGVSSSAVLAFVEAADKDIDALHSFMLVRHGHVVAEGWWAPYDAETPHIALLAEQELHLDGRRPGRRRGEAERRRPGAEVLPRRRPGRAERRTSRRCASATCSACPPATRPSRPARPDEPWTKTFLAQPVPFKPGTHFLYNTSATYMLSAIVQKATGQTVLDYLQAAPVRAARHREPDLGDQPAGHLARRLRPERPHRGHRQVRPALPAEGEVARQAARPRGVGRGGDRAADLQRQQPEERLGPGLRLPVLALPPRRLPRRRGVRPVSASCCPSRTR